MDILAIVPARSGSKGIPEKNIKLFNGKPLIQYAIELAQNAQKKGIIVDYIISTNDQGIASVAKNIGGNVPFLRPNKLAGDTSPVIETIMHAVRWWEESHNNPLHSVLLLQPTNPLTTLKDVEDATKHYIKNQPDAKCLISICDAQHLRLSTLYHEKGKYLEQLSKEIDAMAGRQAFRRLYQRNGAVYISRRDMLFTDYKIVNENPLFYEMPRERSVAIDDTFDWQLAEFLMDRHDSGKPNDI